MLNWNLQHACSIIKILWLIHYSGVIGQIELKKNPLNLTGMHCKSLTVILTPPPSPTLLCEAGFAEKEWKKVAK